MNKKTYHLIKKTIEKYKMFNQDDKILVASSGGKDSQFLIFALNKLGYKFDCVFIDLGIPNFSEGSFEKVKELCDLLNITLYNVQLKKLVGKSIPEIKTKKPYCSVCGNIKRYLINKFAYNNNYDVVLTGHTINDGLRVLLHSLFHWNIEYLPKLSPVSKKDRTFVKKAKPLFFVWEKDIIKEVEKNEIPYISKKCPLSKKAKTKEMDEIINKVIEIKGKPFLETFLKGFLKKRKIFKNEFTLNECIVCGSLTSSEKCSFCKLFNLNKSIDLKH